MNSEKHRQFFGKTRGKLLLALVYFTSINLLAGFAATWLKFPSLWGNSQVFDEYAIPILMTWGTAHWPSLLLVGIPLLNIYRWSALSIRRFRLACVVVFLLLMYGVKERFPFALFPAVDVFVAFFFSLVIVPFSYKENPVLTVFIAILIAVSSVTGASILYSQWKHRVPAIQQAELMGGLFRLESIAVNPNYRQLLFTVELTRYIEQSTACATATELGKAIFEAYEYDREYTKIIKITFNPEPGKSGSLPYPLGEVGQYRNQDNGEIYVECYIQYK